MVDEIVTEKLEYEIRNGEIWFKGDFLTLYDIKVRLCWG